MRDKARTPAEMALFRRVGENVRAAREAAGLSQYDICRSLGMSQAYISLVESGVRNIGILNLSRIAGICGVDPADLLKPPSERAAAKSVPAKRPR